MPFFNAAMFIDRAVQSILAQTFPDFELLAIDDGSTDASAAILLEIDDPRLRLISHSQNRGLATRLNEGIAAAKAACIARMDADDISFPKRLEHQVRFLDEHPDISLVGTQVEVIDGTDSRGYRLPTDPRHIRWRLHLGNCIGHPTIMARRALFEDLGGYDESLRSAQDYDLWLRAAPTHLMANLPHRLHGLRMRHESLSRVDSEVREDNADHSLARALSQALSRVVSVEAARLIRIPRQAHENHFVVHASEAASALGQFARMTLADPELGGELQVRIKREAQLRLTQLWIFTRERDRHEARRLYRNSPLLTFSAMALSVIGRGLRFLSVLQRKERALLNIR